MAIVVAGGGVIFGAVAGAAIGVKYMILKTNSIACDWSWDRGLKRSGNWSEGWSWSWVWSWDRSWSWRWGNNWSKNWSKNWGRNI